MAVKVDDLNLVVESYIKNTIREAHPEIDVSTGSVMDDLFVKPLLSVLKPLVETINDNELQIDLVNYPFMTDEQIDAKGQNNYFISRNEGVKSTGTVSFQVSDIPRNTTFVIPVGTIVSTASGLKFRTIENVKLTPAEAASYYNYNTFVYDIPASVEADDVGSEYNVAAGEVTVLETGFSNNVKSVKNYQAISGGTDREDNETYIGRIRDFYVNNFEGCKPGYSNTVYDVRPDVSDLYIAGFRDKFMFRDKGSYVDMEGTAYEGNIGGKVDIYLKGDEAQNYESELEITNGRKKIEHLYLVNQTEWNNTAVLVVKKANKDAAVSAFKSLIYDDSLTEQQRSELKTTLYTYNVPHTFKSFPEVSYHCVAFADSATGANLTSKPTGKSYIGIIKNSSTSDIPTDASKFSWSRINQEYGMQMPVGTDGKIKYIWIKYADDVYGTGMTDLPEGKKYIGISYDRNTVVKSDDYQEYTWFKVDTGITSSYAVGLDELEYHYIEISEDTITNEVMDNQEATLFYYYKTVDSELADVFFNSEDFVIKEMTESINGPIINSMIALQNTTTGDIFDVFNYPSDFYNQYSKMPQCPPEDKFTYKGTILETIDTFFVRENLGFNGEQIKWTYSKNATIADIDKHIMEEANRVVTTDVLIRPAGVKYVNIKIRVKPADGITLNDTLDDTITKIISDRIYDLKLGEYLDEATLISDLYSGPYTIKDSIDYIELPFKSIYPVTEEQLNDVVIDNKRGDFARDLNDYDVPTVFKDNKLPITVSKIQYVKLNKLVIEEITD